MNKLFIGIDPGVNTGIAFRRKGEKELIFLVTTQLHRAFDMVKSEKANIEAVVIENPNLWNYFKNDSGARARAQGAGSVKRDFKAWTDFFADNEIPFHAVRPDKKRNQLAANKETFEKITGYRERSSEHSRVAAMMIIGL